MFLLDLAVLMQNLIVLCQHCFSWVETLTEMCPECGADVVLDRPDPDRNSLAEVFGSPLMLLGTVSVERSVLPSYGELIGTSEGLLFLPRLNRRLNGAWEEVSISRTPSWWPVLGEINSTRFLDWLRRPLSLKANVAETSAEAVPLKQTSLADRLMDAPGAFFVEHRVIHSVIARRKTVKLDRQPRRSVTFIDESEKGTLKALLDTLSVQAAWHETRTAR